MNRRKLLLDGVAVVTAFVALFFFGAVFVPHVLETVFAPHDAARFLPFALILFPVVVGALALLAYLYAPPPATIERGLAIFAFLLVLLGPFAASLGATFFAYSEINFYPVGEPWEYLVVIWLPTFCLWVAAIGYSGLLSTRATRLWARLGARLSGWLPPGPLWPALGCLIDRCWQRLMDLSFGDAGPVPQPPLKPLDVATYEQALTDHYHATVQDLVNTMNTLPAGFERRNQELHRTFAQFEQEALAVATRLRKQATQRHLQNPAPTVWAEKYRRMVATDVAR